jgi:tetratricopeptide (TPR) repeat protein
MRRDLKISQSLVGKRPTFHQERDAGFSYRVLLWMILILAGVFIIVQNQRGVVEPLFLPTPTPTRTAGSFLMEARTHFDAGRIEDPINQIDAIHAYRNAVETDAANPQVRAEFARVLAYSARLLSTVEQRRERLEEARQQIDIATDLEPDDSFIQAIRAFVYNWNSPRVFAGDQAQSYLAEARQAAARALQLDPNNALALAFYAEVLVDQQEWVQAEQYIKQAVQLDNTLMDAHRIHGYVNESLGYYNAAIDEYLKAAEINPNLTFLYISVGLNFRALRVYNRALEYFEKAANINDALDIRNPIPYLEIARTYAQLGEFFIASRNAEKALSFNPTDANTYGQLGGIYVQARNYEGALPILQCAVEGCSVTISPDEIRLGDERLMFCPVGGCTVPGGEFGVVEVEGLPLSSAVVAYYYLRYGSVLAAMNICDRAIPVLRQVAEGYPNDPVMMSIIDENYRICRVTTP